MQVDQIQYHWFVKFNYSLYFPSHFLSSKFLFPSLLLCTPLLSFSPFPSLPFASLLFSSLLPSHFPSLPFSFILFHSLFFFFLKIIGLGAKVTENESNNCLFTCQNVWYTHVEGRYQTKSWSEIRSLPWMTDMHHCSTSCLTENVNAISALGHSTIRCRVSMLAQLNGRNLYCITPGQMPSVDLPMIGATRLLFVGY